MVPVMAEHVPVRPEMVPVMAEAVPVTASKPPVMDEAVPVVAASVMMAASVAPPPGDTARTVPAPATRQTDPVMPGVAIDATPVLFVAPAAAHTRPSVCPYLGFKDDPSTRCDFADPRNRCHATSALSAAPIALPRRVMPGQAGTRRSREIDASHQTSRCLTEAHGECARYPAVNVPATS
jgi:hypothetical protein